MIFRYVRPDESVMFAPVSGTVDADFSASALTDGEPGSPAKRSTGDPSWTIATTAPVSVSLIAVCNHTVDAGRAVNITGDVTATVTPESPEWPDGIPRNPYTTCVTTSVSSMVVGVTGNSRAVVMGELYAGTARALERHLSLENIQVGVADPFEREGEFQSLAPYDNGVMARTLSGEVNLSTTGLRDVQQWWASTRRGTRPTLIVPFSSENDAWLVTFRYGWQPVLTNRFRVTFMFQELPRTRW